MPGEYVVGLLASIFLDKNRVAKLSTTRALFGIHKILLRKKAVSPCNPKLATPLLSKQCAHIRQFMVVRCQRTIIFVTLPIAIAA